MDLKKMMGGLSKSGALSGFVGGVAGGGLTSMMSGKKGKKVGKSALKVGALAAVGGLAWKAYQTYSAKNQTGATPGAYSQTPSAIPQHGHTQQTQHSPAAQFDFRPAVIEQQAFEEVVEDSNPNGQMLLMRAMIAAAHSDGHIDDNERQRIFAQVDSMDLSIEEKASLFDELRKPLDLQALVAQVPNAQTGIEVYAASASAIELNDPQSQQYLQALASNLCIPSELTASIHEQLQSV